MDYREHLQAYLNYAAQAQKKVGKYKSKPVYGSFKKFYDYEAKVKEALDDGKKGRFNGLSRYMKSRMEDKDG